MGKPGDVFLCACVVCMVLVPVLLLKFSRLTDITYRLFFRIINRKKAKRQSCTLLKATEAINFADVQDDFITEYYNMKRTNRGGCQSLFHYFSL